MHIGIKDVLIWGALGLGAAVAVNHYAELNIPVLNEVEGIITSSGKSSGLRASSEYVSPSGDKDSGCYDKSKVSGDRRMQLRQLIETAKQEKDWDRQRELEDQLRAIDEEERGDCR